MSLKFWTNEPHFMMAILLPDHVLAEEGTHPKSDIAE